MSGERVRSYLMEHGVKYATHAHPKAYTTAEIAEAEQVPGDQMAKVVMLIADEAPVMAVLPGSKMINIDKAQETLGAGSVRLATRVSSRRCSRTVSPGRSPRSGPCTTSRCWWTKGCNDPTSPSTPERTRRRSRCP
jgi:hypothetical protein